MGPENSSFKAAQKALIHVSVCGAFSGPRGSHEEVAPKRTVRVLVSASFRADVGHATGRCIGRGVAVHESREWGHEVGWVEGRPGSATAGGSLGGAQVGNPASVHLDCAVDESAEGRARF